MWQPGQIVFDEYEVVRELGRGGMATVYLLRQLDREVLVAAKLPHADLTAAAGFREALSRELQAWAALPPHPHITRCLFTREFESAPALLAEYVPGGTLGQWQADRRLHDLGHVVDLAIQAGEALLVAETLHFVHQDVKPANCLMDKQGRLKLTDFGLTAATCRTTDQATWGGGTREYCSPEQLDGQHVGTASDIWSLGVLLLELVSGRRPAYGPAAPQLLAEQRQRAALDRVPPALWDLIERMLAWEPPARPASFRQVGAELREVYRVVTGQSYQREFPALLAGTDDEREQLGGFKARAVRLLGLALQNAGRRPEEAQRFLLSSPIASGGLHEALAATTLCAEAERLLRQTGRQGASPTTRALLLAVAQLAADAYHALGNHQGALQVYQRQLEDLHELQQACSGSDARHALTVAIATALQNRAVLRRQSGDLGGASADYQQAKSLLEDTAGDADPERQTLLASVHHNQAMACLKAGDLDGARREVEQAIEVRRRLARDGRAAARVALASSLLNRGLVRRRCGETTDALDDLQAALLMAEGVTEPDLAAERDEVLAAAWINRATALLPLGQCQLARDDCDRAIDLLTRWYAERPGPRPLQLLAQALNNRSQVARARGDVAAATADLERTVQLREQLVNQMGREELASELARAYMNQALLLLDSAQAARAWSICETALRWLEALVARKPQPDLLLDLAKVMLLTGQVHCGLKNVEVGLEYFQAALRRYDQMADPRSPDTIDGWLEALELLLQTGHYLNSAATAPEVERAALRSLEHWTRRAVLGWRVTAAQRTRLQALYSRLAPRAALDELAERLCTELQAIVTASVGCR